MATPLSAAVFALIAEVRGTFDPATIENYLAATSNPQLFNDGTATYPVLAPVPQQGAGLIQAYNAAYATTLLSVSSLSFNDTDNLVDTLNFTISNLGTEGVSYDLASVGAATAYTFSTSIYPDPFPGLGLDDSFAAIALSESKVTVAAGDNAVIAVTVTPPAIDGTLLPVYSGYITLNGTNGDSLSLPYQGIVGSLLNTQVLDPDYTYLSISSDPDLNPIVGSNSTLSDAVLPVAVVSLAFGSPLVNIEAVTVGSGNATTNLGNIFELPLPYMSRDSFALEWDGQLEDGSYAPAGQYKLLVSALHIFGDASDSADYDIVETTEFTIKYS
jgi:hypothetical protein